MKNTEERMQRIFEKAAEKKRKRNAYMRTTAAIVICLICVGGSVAAGVNHGIGVIPIQSGLDAENKPDPSSTQSSTHIRTEASIGAPSTGIASSVTETKVHVTEDTASVTSSKPETTAAAPVMTTAPMPSETEQNGPAPTETRPAPPTTRDEADIPKVDDDTTAPQEEPSGALPPITEGDPTPSTELPTVVPTVNDSPPMAGPPKVNPNASVWSDEVIDELPDGYYTWQNIVDALRAGFICGSSGSNGGLLGSIDGTDLEPSKNDSMLIYLESFEQAVAASENDDAIIKARLYISCDSKADAEKFLDENTKSHICTGNGYLVYITKQQEKSISLYDVPSSIVALFELSI